MDFKPEESVLYNKGQGYKLKPVIEIAGISEIVGIFRGNLVYNSKLGEMETVIELKNDGKFRAKFAEYPNYLVKGDYYYNSFFKNLKFSNLIYDLGDMSDEEKEEIKKHLKNSVEISVKQWSIDELIVVDVDGMQSSLYLVDTFGFSSSTKYTNIEIEINNPNSSDDGKYVYTYFEFLEDLPPYYIETKKLDNGKVINNIQINDSYFKKERLKVKVTSYMIKDIKKLNRKVMIINDKLTLISSSNNFTSCSVNPWSNEENSIFELKKGDYNKIEISFPKKLNIRFRENVFTEIHPTLEWDCYPNASEYYVLVLVPDKNHNEKDCDDDGSEIWDATFCEKVSTTSIQVIADQLVPNVDMLSGYGIFEPYLTKGDLIRVEIFALDGSGKLNTRNKKGALFMDSLTIIKP